MWSIDRNGRLGSAMKHHQDGRQLYLALEIILHSSLHVLARFSSGCAGGVNLGLLQERKEEEKVREQKICRLSSPIASSMYWTSL